jgi:hypothetical protein
MLRSNRIAADIAYDRRVRQDSKQAPTGGGLSDVEILQ